MTFVSSVLLGQLGPVDAPVPMYTNFLFFNQISAWYDRVQQAGCYCRFVCRVGRKLKTRQNKALRLKCEFLSVQRRGHGYIKTYQRPKRHPVISDYLFVHTCSPQSFRHRDRCCLSTVSIRTKIRNVATASEK